MKTAEQSMQQACRITRKQIERKKPTSERVHELIGRALQAYANTAPVIKVGSAVTVKRDIHQRLGDFYFQYAFKTGRVIDIETDSDGERVFGVKFPGIPIAGNIQESEIDLA